MQDFHLQGRGRKLLDRPVGTEQETAGPMMMAGFIVNHENGLGWGTVQGVTDVEISRSRMSGLSSRALQDTGIGHIVGIQILQQWGGLPAVIFRVVFERFADLVQVGFASPGGCFGAEQQIRSTRPLTGVDAPDQQSGADQCQGESGSPMLSMGADFKQAHCPENDGSDSKSPEPGPEHNKDDPGEGEWMQRRTLVAFFPFNSPGRLLKGAFLSGGLATALSLCPAAGSVEYKCYLIERNSIAVVQARVVCAMTVDLSRVLRFEALKVAESIFNRDSCVLCCQLGPRERYVTLF